MYMRLEEYIYHFDLYKLMHTIDEKTTLRPWQEIIGTVDDVETYKEIAVIRISSRRRVSLEIPINELKECDMSLEQLIGQRISILRTDNDFVMNTSSQDDDPMSTVPRRRD